MATLINKKDYECYPKLTLVKPSGAKKIRNTKATFNHEKAAKSLLMTFRNNGIEIHKVQ